MTAIGLLIAVIAVFVRLPIQSGDASATSIVAAKESLYKLGFPITWKNEVSVCVFGDRIETRFSETIGWTIEGLSALTGLKITQNYSDSLRSCPPQTQVFVVAVDGRVSRSGLEKTYHNISRFSSVAFDPQDPELFQSSFAQTAFLRDRERVISIILLNQLSDHGGEIATTFLRSGVLEELYQTIALASDVAVDASPTSLLEEQNLHTPFLWQGFFEEHEVESYLDARPNGLCHLDVALLKTLYPPKGETAIDSMNGLLSRIKDVDVRAATLGSGASLVDLTC